MSLSAVTIDTTATGIVIAAQNNVRKQLRIKSLSTNTVDVFLKFDDSATVLTAANGYPLKPGEEIVLLPVIGANGCSIPHQVKGITASSSAELRVQELN